MKIVSIKLVIFITMAMALFACTSKQQEIREKHIAGMYEETIPELKQMIEKNPNNAEAHFLLATAYLNTGDFNSSEKRFNSVLKLQKNESSKPQIRRNMGQKYKNALFNFLEAEKCGDKYLFERMLKFADINTLALVKNHLKIFCNNRMNRRNYFQAFNGYKYLARLNPSLNKEIGQKHLALFNEIDDQKLKNHIIDNAVKFSREDSVIKAHAEHHYALSKQAKTTKEAITQLKIANQSDKRFGDELYAKQKQLKHEQLLVLVKKNEKKRGKAKFVAVSKPGEFKSAGTIPKSSKITYLSIYDFKVHYDTGKISEWKAAVNEENWKEIYHSENMTLQFEAIDKPTDIYYWVEKI